MWTSVSRFIKNYDSFLISSHVNPDGDAIGSEMALKAFLEDMGKEVAVVNASATPASLSFLDPHNEIQHYPTQVDRNILKRVDAIIILDLNTWEQLGGLAGPVQHSPLPRACIDHHQGADPDFAGVLVSDTTCAATGILVCELIRAMNGSLTRDIADAAYAAIITDTGTFRFSNTDARAFRLAADLVEAGANPFALHRQVFASKTWGTARALGPIMGTIDSTAGGRLAWICATKQMLDDARATYDDLDGFVDLVRAVRGVELVLFFKETVDGAVKVSLRSNGNVDAYAIASHFGGGGHRMASGVRMDGPMAAAVKRLVDMACHVDGIRA